MNPALKNSLYKEAKKLLKTNGQVVLWSGLDDPLFRSIFYTNAKELSKAFIVAYEAGWPIIRAE